MTTSENTLAVTSHVGRDLEQSASLFKTDKQVIWEYVVNGLEYVEEGVAPIVKIKIEPKKKRISISDNCRGMSWDDLANFFIMHGENVDRKKGKGRRGFFGTGKSAAFGIADTLRVTTVRNGLQSQVLLNRDMIRSPQAKERVPVDVIEKNKSVSRANGTLVEIEDVNLRGIDNPGIIKYVERHLLHLHWSKNAKIFVNDHECEVAEPAFVDVRTYSADGKLQELAGNVQLVLKVSGSPLDAEMRGVAILSDGVWFESTLAGSENKDMSEFIFGTIDVPLIQNGNFPIPAFDLSRNMQLNRENELVQAIVSFVGRHVDALRRELVEMEKRRRASEEARKLEGEAAKIAELLNSDFLEFKSKISSIKAKTRGLLDNADSPVASREENEEILKAGSELASQKAATSALQGDGGRDGGGDSGRGEPPAQSANLREKMNDGSPNAQRSSGTSTKSSRSGGFGVNFKNMGEQELRAKYTPLERVIYINLDHPQFVAARGSDSLESVTFRHLSYEVAFSEYAIALASELANNDQYGDPSDPIVDIRDTMNRLARRAAKFFSPSTS